MRRAVKLKLCRRCSGPLRSVVEVAAELRTWAPIIRAQHLQQEEGYAEKYPETAPSPREVNVGADRYVAYCADLDLPALATELEGRLCQWCARRATRGFLTTRRLVFEALLAEYRTTGRDERAEEEFELARCAA